MDEKEEDWLEHLNVARSRGKAPPKKKRTAAGEYGLSHGGIPLTFLQNRRSFLRSGNHKGHRRVRHCPCNKRCVYQLYYRARNHASKLHTCAFGKDWIGLGFLTNCCYDDSRSIDEFACSHPSIIPVFHVPQKPSSSSRFGSDVPIGDNTTCYINPGFDRCFRPGSPVVRWISPVVCEQLTLLLPSLNRDAFRNAYRRLPFPCGFF